MSRINVCFSADDNYAQHCGVAILSILSNAKQSDNLYLYILDGGIKNDNREKLLDLARQHGANLEFVEININDFDNCLPSEYLSVAAYFRFLIPSLLPDIDKIIYFDCDIIVINSLEELFETDISQYYFAGVEDIGYFYERTVSGIKDRFLYVNTGVLLINCKMWRDEKISDKLFDYTELNKDRIIHHDQDVINYVLKSRTLALDLKWNVQESFYSGFRDIHPLKDEITISITSPSIIHFTSQRKPWLAFSTHPQRHLYLDYLRSSSWKDNAPSTASVLLATFELFMKYWWKHPVFFVKPKFWHQMSQVGFKKVIEPGIKAVFPVNLLDLE